MECRHTFPDGRRCRCRATASHVFCRQHAPQPRVPTLRNRDVPFRRWIDLRRVLPTLDRAEIPGAILFVLGLLLQEGPRIISDANAGVLLRHLLRRFGSVPFTLPGDPAPEPDPAYAYSTSLDRLDESIRLLTARFGCPPCGPAGPEPWPPITRSSSQVVGQSFPIRSSVESKSVPHYVAGGRGVHR